MSHTHEKASGGAGRGGGGGSRLATHSRQGTAKGPPSRVPECNRRPHCAARCLRDDGCVDKQSGTLTHLMSQAVAPLLMRIQYCCRASTALAWWNLAFLRVEVTLPAIPCARPPALPRT